jgi:flavin-dependent thymidylate synthase
MENKVTLLGYYGGDETIACSAWTSTSRDLTDEKRARIPALIKQLWDNGHGTPFEKATVHFLVDTEIASHIHLLKHRISSLNAESARYKELKEDKFYLPEDWWEIKVTPDVKDDLNYPQEEYMDWFHALEIYTQLGNKLYHKSLEQLTPVIGRKRAKESARYFKTYNSQIQADVMFNMRSFHNFLTQRMDSHAQLEIQDISKQMLELIKNIEGNPFKNTLSAWAL